MKCPLCLKETSDIHAEIEQLVVDLIARDHPEWKRADGSCPSCLSYYADLGVVGPDFELDQG